MALQSKRSFMQSTKTTSFHGIIHTYYMMCKTVISLLFSNLCTGSQLLYTDALNKVLTTYVSTSNVTSVTKVRLFAGMWRPLVSVITILYYVAMITFHRQVW